MLDKINVLTFVQPLVVCFLADIHSITQNKERQYISATAHGGITRDISKLLQFIFWKKVPYLYHICLFRDPNKRTGDIYGYSPDVGDKLIYYIFYDQTDQIVSISIVLPFTSNYHMYRGAKRVFDRKTGSELDLMRTSWITMTMLRKKYSQHLLHATILLQIKTSSLNQKLQDPMCIIKVTFNSTNN